MMEQNGDQGQNGPKPSWSSKSRRAERKTTNNPIQVITVMVNAMKER
jgi:hypothetical protein